jgi:hypothetical protein
MKKAKWGQDLLTSDRLLTNQFNSLTNLVDLSKEFLCASPHLYSISLSLSSLVMLEHTSYLRRHRLFDCFFRTDLNERMALWSDDAKSQKVGDLFRRILPKLKQVSSSLM